MTNNYITATNEAGQLMKLLKALKKINDDADSYLDSYFNIEIAGEVIKLVCGGPQLEGLYCLVDQIAAENLYDVDYKNCIITE